jgi:hypothetical protein
LVWKRLIGLVELLYEGIVKAYVVVPTSVEDERKCFAPVGYVRFPQLYFHDYFLIPQLLYHYINLFTNKAIIIYNKVLKDKL